MGADNADDPDRSFSYPRYPSHPRYPRFHSYNAPQRLFHDIPRSLRDGSAATFCRMASNDIKGRKTRNPRMGAEYRGFISVHLRDLRFSSSNYLK
jgi:hypothetical protein